MKTKKLILGVMLILAANAVVAVTKVVTRDADSETAVMYIEAPKARVDMPGSVRYVIIDTKAQSLHMVDTDQRQVVDMSDAFANRASGGGAGKYATPKLRREGKGPKIAGYDTIKYRYSAGGKACGVIFASKSALADSGMNAVFEAMQRMTTVAQALEMPSEDPCESVDLENVDDIGAPMRVLDAAGAVQMEVVEIAKDASLPANGFTIPKGYQVQNTGQMASQVQQQMQQQMPQLQEMIRQMQQSGQMTPEMMQKLQQAQEMMKKYQQ